ncbi:hypothetical protein ACQ4M3_30665 [Leptolyngbya sp. AN03gr2]|uniref:hypothetical protein n=1 Tax=unclassified Leptolyngbya TaxID=2650499 RepID=UPI003D30FE46
MSNTSDHSYTIPVLNSQAALPQFAFFQVVKVKLTGEVATIVGMKYDSSSEQSESQNQEWLYLLKGLTKLGAVWCKFDQLRSLDRR